MEIDHLKKWEDRIAEIKDPAIRYISDLQLRAYLNKGIKPDRLLTLEDCFKMAEQGEMILTPEISHYINLNREFIALFERPDFIYRLRNLLDRIRNVYNLIHEKGDFGLLIGTCYGGNYGAKMIITPENVPVIIVHNDFEFLNLRISAALWAYTFAETENEKNESISLFVNTLIHFLTGKSTSEENRPFLFNLLQRNLKNCNESHDFITDVCFCFVVAHEYVHIQYGEKIFDLFDSIIEQAPFSETAKYINRITMNSPMELKIDQFAVMYTVFCFLNKVNQKIIADGISFSIAVYEILSHVNGIVYDNSIRSHPNPQERYESAMQELEKFFRKKLPTSNVYSTLMEMYTLSYSTIENKLKNIYK